jgi:hypothetical protein
MRSSVGAFGLAVAALAAAGDLRGGSTEEGRTSQGPPAGWIERVTERIAQAEYEFSPAGAGAWTAPNRAHDLRARLGEGGLELTSRTRGEAAWRLTLDAALFGREGALEPAGRSRIEAAGSRAELRRDGFTEWYVNDPRGLEQGFTIEGPPDGGDPRRPLVIGITLDGDVSAALAEDGRAVLISDAAGGTVLRYAELAAFDASGVPLEARLALRPGRIEILVEDAGAAYPITVDPLMTFPSWTRSSFFPGGVYGWSAATAGDVNGDGYSDVIVGAPGYDNGQAGEGRVYVYHGGPSGPATIESWRAEADLVVAYMGKAVATAGDVNGDGYDDVIVGAPNYSNGEGGEGAAFLWLGGAAGLGPDGTPANADWSAESNNFGAEFGASVAAAGDVNGNGRDDVVIGCPRCSSGSSEEGRAYVFLGVASGLAVLPVWTAESNQADAHFGESVSSAGDVNADGYADLVIGASGYDNGSSNEGMAFVWHGGASFGSGADGTPANANWWAEADQASAILGRSVAGAGDVNGDGYADVLIGVPGYDGSDSNEGRALLFYGSGGGLGVIGSPLNADWIAEPDVANMLLGTYVATAGDVDGDGYADVIVGADSWENGEVFEGAAFVWTGGPSGPGPTGTPSNAVWKREGNEESARYGYSVATAGDVNGDGYGDIIVGAPNADVLTTNDGKAEIFRGSAAGLAAAPGWSSEGNLAFSRFGRSVAMAGDVNGDGFTDVVVGAPLYDAGQTNEGRAFVFVGGPSGPGPLANWTAESDQAEAQLGASVAPAGDVNGDGYADVLVGAPFYEKGPANEGGAFVWFGGPSDILNPSGLGPDGTPLNADGSFTSGAGGAALGSAVASAGDVNRDGFGDVILGAPTYAGGTSGQGAAYVLLGSAAGPGGATWIVEGGQVGAHLGASVAGAGDVNGDGHSDVIVGAPLWDGAAGIDEGRALVFLGKGGGLASTPAWTASSLQAGAQLGASVAGAGDVNRDGFGDVIAGAPLFANGEATEGTALAWHGGPAGLGPDGDPSNADWRYEPNQATALFGASVADAGDVDGDGCSDVVIGAAEYSGGESNEGRAYLFRGSVSGLLSAPSWTVEADQVGALLGQSVAGGGDVDGDGFGDVLVGAHLYDNGQADEGRAWMYYGHGGDGLHRIPRQARSDDGALIGPRGRSDSATSFRLRALGRSAAGRSSVRLQWEVEPLGSPFDANGIVSGAAAYDTGAPDFIDGSAVELGELVSGLDPGTYHHWRVRIRSDSPFFPRSPWFSPPFDGRHESDLRTAGCVDRDGDGFGAPADAGCAQGPLLDCHDGDAAVHPGAGEACNGEDDDCDGAVDGFATLCGVGECARTGTCTAGVDSCAPGGPSPETCDALDNDCDGIVDEFATRCGVGACASTGFCGAGSDSCVPGSPSPEACDGADNDCDGIVPPEEADADGDRVRVCGGDCDDGDASIWSAPVETQELRAELLAPAGDRLTWEDQAPRSGPGTLYDVFTGSLWGSSPPGDFSGGRCLSDGQPATAIDLTGLAPAPGQIFYFMVRAQNACPCGTATYGTPDRDATAAAGASPCL